MAIARTAHGGTPVTSSTAGTSQAIATTAAVGESIVVAVGTVDPAAVTTPTDTASNSYVQLGAFVANTERITVWGCLSNKAASPTVTAHFSSSRFSVAIETYSGVLAFNQSNTTTSTGAASPATATLPKALGFSSSWSLAAFANKGTATWSASTGNLRANVAGASTTTPGVAIVDNTTTTSAAAESGSNVWAGTIIELFGQIEIDDDVLTQQPMNRDVRFFQHDDMETLGIPPNFIPPADVPDDLSKFDATWRAFAFVDEESEKSIAAIVIPTSAEDGLEQRNSDWRAFIDEVPSLDEPGQLGPPAVAIQIEHIEQKNIDWRAVYDHTSDTDEPGGLAAPPTTVELDELQKFDAGWQVKQQDDTATENDFLFQPPTVEPMRVPFEPEGVEMWTLDDWSLPLPPTFTDESEHYRPVFIPFGLTQEDLDNPFVVIPPVTTPNIGLDDIEAHYKAQDILRGPDELDSISLQLPPTANDDGLAERPSDWRAVYDPIAEMDEPGQLGAPSFAVQDDETPKYVGLTWLYDPTAETDEPGQLGAPAVSIQEEASESKNVDWTARQYEDVEMQSGSAPTPPVTFQEEPIEKQSDWRQLFQEDLETQRELPPPPPTTFQEEPIEKYAGWSALQYEDADTASNTTPAPPTAFQEEPIEKNLDTRQLLHEDPETQRAVPPTPPSAIQFEESEQKNIDWQVKQQEDTDTQNAATPAPPAVQQFEESEQKNVDWKSLHEDGTESGKTPPPPPPAVNQGWDDLELSVHAQDTVLQYHEDDLRTLPPTPPVTEQDEISERSLPPTALQPEDDARVLPPTPPTGQPDIFVEQWVDWRMWAIEDDLSTASPRPPFAIQDQEDTLWRGTWTPIVEDDWRTSAPQPPTFADAEEPLFTGAPVKFDEVLAAEKTPPPPVVTTTAGDDLEAQFHAAYQSFGQEEDGSAFLPKIPVVQQFEESEQKNVDYVARQYDDTETQQILPVPPTADDFDHSQMLTFVPMAIPFDEADANEFPPPPPPLVIGAGRDDEESQVYREFAGPYFEAIQEQWIWFSGFIYPTSVIGSGNIQVTSGSGSVTPVSGSGQITPVGGSGQVSEVSGSGEVDPVDGNGKVN